MNLSRVCEYVKTKWKMDSSRPTLQSSSRLSRSGAGHPQWYRAIRSDARSIRSDARSIRSDARSIRSDARSPVPKINSAVVIMFKQTCLVSRPG